MGETFLGPAQLTPAAQALVDEDLADDGYVWNATRLWSYQPENLAQLFELMSATFAASGLDRRQRGILVAAAVSTLGDSYCSLAWGGKLTKLADAAVAEAVLRGTDEGLSEQERALAVWARAVATDPNATTPEDVQALRDAGLTDAQVFAVTFFVALRLAFSTVNDALGAHPDLALLQTLPPGVVAAVTYGRPPTD
jgi:uncharacterized peroxidase-related enzyme